MEWRWRRRQRPNIKLRHEPLVGGVAEGGEAMGLGVMGGGEDSVYGDEIARILLILLHQTTMMMTTTSRCSNSTVDGVAFISPATT